MPAAPVSVPAVNGPTEREQRYPMLSAAMARAAVIEDRDAGKPYALVNPDWLVALIDHATEADRESAALRARVAVLEQQIAAIEALHRPTPDMFGEGCDGCHRDWPCPTALAAGVDPKGSMVVDNPTEPGACMCGRRIEEHVGPFGTQCPPPTEGSPS